MWTLIIESKFSYILGILSTVNNDYLFKVQQICYYMSFRLLICFHVSLAFELLQIAIDIINVFKTLNQISRKGQPIEFVTWCRKYDLVICTWLFYISYIPHSCRSYLQYDRKMEFLVKLTTLFKPSCICHYHHDWLCSIVTSATCR